MHNNADKLISLCSNCPQRRSGLCIVLHELAQSACHELHLQSISVQAKQHLFSQDEPLHDTYILRDGWFQLYRLTESGSRQVFPPVLPGEIIGLHTDNNTKSPYFAVAMQNSVICKISQIHQLSPLNPRLGMMLAALSDFDSVKTEMYLANIAKTDAKQRIAFLALELYHRFKLKKLNNGIVIPFPLKQTDIADMLGLTSVHVSRTLEHLKEEGLLEIHKQTLTILDYPQLQDLVGEYLEPIGECDQVLC